MRTTGAGWQERAGAAVTDPDRVGDKAVQNDYWKTAMVAARFSSYRAMSRRPRFCTGLRSWLPLEHGSHESTFSQAQLLLAALDATAEQQAKIAAAFHPFLSQE